MTPDDPLIAALERLLCTTEEARQRHIAEGTGSTVADGLYAIAEAINRLAEAVEAAR